MEALNFEVKKIEKNTGARLGVLHLPHGDVETPVFMPVGTQATVKSMTPDEMKDMIHERGGKNYSIFLDKETMVLYGYMEIEDEELWAKGADTAINRKWWDFMADIMETNPDNSPVSEDLHLVFHLDW